MSVSWTRRIPHRSHHDRWSMIVVPSIRAAWMTGPARSSSVPKMMLPVYGKMVGLTDNVCDRHLNSEYRDLARAMTAVLCRKRPSPLTSGQRRTWACGVVYVLGRINFLGDPSLFSAHDDRGTVFRFRSRRAHHPCQGARHRKAAWHPTVRSVVDASEFGRDESAGVDGRGEWPSGRFAGHVPRSSGNCIRRWVDSVYPGGSQRPIVNALVAREAI
jgi:hypothetical protein